MCGDNPQHVGQRRWGVCGTMVGIVAATVGPKVAADDRRGRPRDGWQDRRGHGHALGQGRRENEGQGQGSVAYQGRGAISYFTDSRPIIAAKVTASSPRHRRQTLHPDEEGKHPQLGSGLIIISLHELRVFLSLLIPQPRHRERSRKRVRPHPQTATTRRCNPIHHNQTRRNIGGGLQRASCPASLRRAFGCDARQRTGLPVGHTAGRFGQAMIGSRPRGDG